MSQGIAQASVFVSTSTANKQSDRHGMLKHRKMALSQVQSVEPPNPVPSLYEYVDLRWGNGVLYVRGGVLVIRRTLAVPDISPSLPLIWPDHFRPQVPFRMPVLQALVQQHHLFSSNHLCNTAPAGMT